MLNQWSQQILNATITINVDTIITKDVEWNNYNRCWIHLLQNILNNDYNLLKMLNALIKLDVEY